MSTTSDVCFPLEILYEFILQSSSSPSTLAAWCSVSRSLLAFAGPLLYRVISLKRSEDVMPFIKRLRLARSSSTTPPSSSLLHPFVKDVQQLEILALPPKDDLLDLAQRTRLAQAHGRLLLRVNWKGKTREEMSTFFVPTLLLEVLPTSYEEIGGRRVDLLPFAEIQTWLVRLSSQRLVPPSSRSYLGLVRPQSLQPSPEEGYGLFADYLELLGLTDPVMLSGRWC